MCLSLPYFFNDYFCIFNFDLYIIKLLIFSYFYSNLIILVYAFNPNYQNLLIDMFYEEFQLEFLFFNKDKVYNCSTFQHFFLYYETHFLYEIINFNFLLNFGS